ncbi:MAG: hypothetical protein LIP09_15745 [Bacteroidales bacterium]|nr:hypothetical protein [Bacteroidales bacterium]
MWRYAIIILNLIVACGQGSAEELSPQERYDLVHRDLARGWNTWDTRSVLNQLYMPYAFGLELQLEDSVGQRKSNFRIGERGTDAATLRPYAHAYDGSYWKIGVQWHGIDLEIESASQDSTNVTILHCNDAIKDSKLIVRPTTFWMRGNQVAIDSMGNYQIGPKDKSLIVKGAVLAPHLKIGQGQIIAPLSQDIIIANNFQGREAEARSFVSNKAKNLETAQRSTYGDNYDCYKGMQTVLGWNNIYDPTIRRVITPVSRIWSSEWFASKDFGGFTLFCWDAYFAAMMLGVDNKELAYANIGEITLALTEAGFVPNCYYSNGFKSRDRSQPPVGSLALWYLYERYGDKWLLELLYDNLLTWNRWWNTNRNWDGLLCQGSSPYEKITYFRSEYDANTRYGAILESGLDNSPMYDEVDFDTARHLLTQQDVGLTSLYVMDCNYLAKIANELDKTDDAAELKARANQYSQALQELWCEEDGMFYNRSAIDGSFNKRTSPTNFYPLIANVATPAQAERMISEHLCNSEEFGGDYVIPATPRNDPSFTDNEYWRGRIWGPLNFLTYLGLCNYDCAEVRKEFAEKSKKLFLQSWMGPGYVFENYNAVTGDGDDILRSDKYYHWGALLALISLIENDIVKI